MKKALFFLSIFCIEISSIAQQNVQSNDFLEGIYNINSNIYDVKAAGEAYFAQDSFLRDGNSYGYKDFIRYLQYWETRSYNDVNISGDLNKYHELIFNYSQNRSTYCNDVAGISDLYNWNFLGPKNLSDQGLGMVTSVAYFDDNGTDVIFAGSAAGGVFMAEYTPGNPSLNWTLISGDIEVPGIGFSDLRVLDDSNGSGKRYLLAGSGLIHRNYSRGIFLKDLDDLSLPWVEVTNCPIRIKELLNRLFNKLYCILSIKKQCMRLSVPKFIKVIVMENKEHGIQFLA